MCRCCKSSMYSEVGITGTRHGHPGWMDQQQGRLRNVGCAVRYIVCFHFSFAVSSACLLQVFSLADSLFAPPFSRRQPVKAVVDPCRQVEMQITSMPE